MTTNTQINITAKDSTAGAFASASGNLADLSSRAVQVAAAFAGIGLSVGGLAASIKSSIDAADRTSELSQKIGVAVEQIAGLELAFKQSGLGADQLQSSISKLSKNVASGSSAFDAMGIATTGADGNLKSTREILAEVSDKFAGYKDGIAKTALAMEIFGKSGADLIPFLNDGSASLAEFDSMAQKLGLTLSTDTAKKADEFNDTLGLIQGSFAGLSNKVAAEMLPTLQGLSDQFLNAAANGENVAQIAGFLSTALKSLVSVGVGVAGTFMTIGTALGGVAAMWGAIINGEFSQAGEIVRNLKADLSNNFASTIDAITESWSDNGTAIAAATNATREHGKQQAPLVKSLEEGKKALESRNKAQEEALRLEHEYVKLLEIERKQRVDLLKPFEASTKKAAEQLDAIKDEISALSSVKANQIDIKEAVERTTIARLKENLSAHQDPEIIKKINDEIEARKKIADLIPIQKKLEEETKKTTDQVSELWKQAGRNIQSTLANSIFNFFDDGLKGMLKNVISTVGRIASEFAALKIAQSIGLAGMFGGAGSAVAGGIGGTGSSFGISNILGAGSNVLSMARGGFGLGGLLGGGAGAFSNIGGAGTAFIGGPGTALGGSGMGGMASMGSMLGPMAGGFAALAAGFMGGKFIAGENKIAGINGTTAALIGTALGGPVGAVVGGAILKLFGREAYKFRQQSLQGTASSQGFEGDITNVERAKGGLLRSNAHRSTSIKFTSEVQDTFDTAVSGFYKSAHGFAENLGLSADLVDNFTKEVQIKSEKGKTVTEEAIAEMIAGIGDGLAKNVIPSIEEFRKAGEKSFDTFARLNSEFSALQQSAINLGASADYAKELVRGLSIATRSAYIEAAGGVDVWLELTNKFNQNFLTQAEQIAPTIKLVEDGLKDLGYSADFTKDQYKSLVQSLIQAGDATGLLLLQYQDQFLAVNSYKESLKQAADATRAAEAEAAKQRSAAEAKAAKQRSAADFAKKQEKTQSTFKRLLDSTDNTLASINDHISKLKALSGQLGSAMQSLAPQSVASARSDILSNISFDKKGGVRGIKNIDAINNQSISTLANQTSGSFSSREDFLRSKAKNFSVLDTLNIATNKDISGSKEAAAITQQMSNLIIASSKGSNATADLYKLLRNMTTNGTALNTVAT